MRIVTNADDFGQDDDTTRATIECFENGSLTSATIMVNMPRAAAAIAYAKSRPDLSFGVHLTYVLGVGNEAPVSDAAKLATLCGPDGLFKPSNRTRIDAILGKLSMAEIARETEAQLGRLRDSGVSISHVDSHGHLHRFAVFQAALREVLPRFNIRRVRSAQNVYLRKLLKSPNYWYGPIWCRQIRGRFTTTTHFYMPTSAWDREWWNPLLDRMPALERGGDTIEVGVHPGYAEAWRIEERTGLASFADAARSRGHTLIGWAKV